MMWRSIKSECRTYASVLISDVLCCIFIISLYNLGTVVLVGASKETMTKDVPQARGSKFSMHTVLYYYEYTTFDE